MAYGISSCKHLNPVRTSTPDRINERRTYLWYRSKSMKGRTKTFTEPAKWKNQVTKQWEDAGWFAYPGKA